MRISFWWSALLPCALAACGADGECGLAGAGCAVGNLHIELRYVTPPGDNPEPTAGQVVIFERVTRRLERVVTRKLGRVGVSLDAGECSDSSPRIQETVDDLLVFVIIEQIDGYSSAGAGTAVAQGTSCLVRGKTHHPIVSYVRLDAADIGWLEEVGMLEPVFLHEMIHAIGFGNVWGPKFFDYLESPSKPFSAGADTHFSGPNAVEAFDLIGGLTYTRRKVPVENNALPQADTHWRASVLKGEIMQPFLEPGRAPALSIVTLRSLEDLGYAIDRTQADQFQLSSTAANPAPAGIRYDLPARTPVRVVDDGGRVLQVIR